MARLKPNPQGKTGPTRIPHRMIIYEHPLYGTLARAWPKRRPRPLSPDQQWYQDQFGQACRMAASLEPYSYMTCVEMTKGRPQVPRDFAISCMYGLGYDVTLPDGRKLIPVKHTRPQPPPPPPPPPPPEEDMSYEKPWTKPLAADFEVQNLPTDATIDDGVKALVFRDKLTSTNTNVMVYAGTAVPTGGASGWYAECRVAIANALQSYGTMGLVIRNSSTNRMAALCVGRDASTLLFNTWNSYTSWNGVISMCDQSTHDAWFRVEKSGTDIKFGYSIDGYNWLWCIFTNTTSGWVATPDEVGLGFNPNGWGSYSQTQGQFATALCASWSAGTI